MTSGRFPIRIAMRVVDCAGTMIGIIDEVSAHWLRTAREGSLDGLHHYIARRWIERVGSDTVHLASNAQIPAGLRGSMS